MTSLWIILSGFFFANVVWFLALINSNYLEYVNPKYLASSYDGDQPDEIESVLLKSLKKHLGKYFTTSRQNNYNSNSHKEEGFRNRDDISSELDFSNSEIIMKNFNSNSSSSNNPALEHIKNNFLNKTLLYETVRNYKYLHFTNSSKVSIFLDKDKKNLYILKFTNDVKSPGYYRMGEISLHYISIKNFLSSNSNSENLNLNSFNSDEILKNSLIRECWSTKIFGKILGAVSSNDKQQLSVYYILSRGNQVNYRIRFFHDMSCENFHIEKSNIEIEQNYLDFLNLKREKQDQISDYYSIDEDEYRKTLEIEDKLSEISQENFKYKKKINLKNFPNFFSDESFDDFNLRGNTPITSMAIKNNILAYARSRDFYMYNILRREKKINNEKGNDSSTTSTEIVSNTIWKVSAQGPLLNRNLFPLYHTNSLKFASDKSHDYKLIQIFLAGNLTEGIKTYAMVYRSNHSEGNLTKIKINENSHEKISKNYSEPKDLYSKEKSDLIKNSTDFSENEKNNVTSDYDNYNSTLNKNNYLFFIKSRDKEVLNLNEEEKFEDFNIDKSMQKLREIMKPTIYSNSYSDKPGEMLLFELYKGYMCLLGWDEKNYEFFYEIQIDGHENIKVSKISSDESQKNIAIKFEKSKEMIYMFRYSNDESLNSKSYYHITKNISFKSVPKKYRNKEITAFNIETIENKIIMFILYHDGILISLDFTKIAQKWQGRSWIISVLFSDFNHTIFYIIFVHFITLLIYLKYYRRRVSEIEPLRNRHNEINQVIQDIIRLNNIQMAIGNNLQNINRVNNVTERAERNGVDNQQIPNFNTTNQNLNQNGNENGNENDIQVMNGNINQETNINSNRQEDSDYEQSNNHQIINNQGLNRIININDTENQNLQNSQNPINENNQIIFDNISDSENS